MQIIAFNEFVSKMDRQKAEPGNLDNGEFQKDPMKPETRDLLLALRDIIDAAQQAIKQHEKNIDVIDNSTKGNDSEGDSFKNKVSRSISDSPESMFGQDH